MGVGSGLCEEAGWLIACGWADQRWSRCVGSSVAGGCGAGEIVTNGCSQSVVVDVGP